MAPYAHSNLPAPSPDPPFEDWVQLASQVAALGRKLQKGIADELRPRNLSDTQSQLRWQIAQADPTGIGQNDLVSMLGLSKGQVSGLVEQLRRQGWIEAHRPTEDRRCQIWRVTESGRQAIDQVGEELSGWAEAMDTCLSSMEKSQFFEMLQRIEEASRTPATPLRVVDGGVE